MAINLTDAKKQPSQTTTAPNLRFQRDRDREMVKGVFKNYENPGGWLGFCTKFYKEDPVERWDFFDEQIYTIPRCVARHLNSNLWYPIHEHAVDPDGKKIMKIGQKVRRAGFQSLEFTDLEDLTPQIVTVENMQPTR